ncbi:hypothetical protein [Mycoplasmopsis alligatoris]|uniref:Uncharacterized protein n=1 Tax=Mycoplasmopsis alligatoris A21JP2 TaxID=747682 RepID=D4XWI7_9BACT|nr:hypothetical protein [Mycoplasmopsis alligatoris]EFF41344.1 hypothetical protein MALL_0443 [Mycoplasmopsis alligatoris A21JP2]
MSKKFSSKKSFTKKEWGIEVRKTNRLSREDGKNIRFGIVITLKEINEKNRIEEFKKMCVYNGWLINEIDINNRLNLVEKLEEEIKLK